MVFVTAGEGGGTGTGAAPGDRRDRQAGDRRADRRRRHQAVRVRGQPAHAAGRSTGIEKLRNEVDTLIIIPNEKLLTIVERRDHDQRGLPQGRRRAAPGRPGHHRPDHVPGLINLDFADVRAIMSRRGSALMGIGAAAGENRAVEAAKAAISSPLLEDVDRGRHGMLLNITGGEDLGLFEVNEAAELISQDRRQGRQHHLRRRRRPRRWATRSGSP